MKNPVAPFKPSISSFQQEYIDQVMLHKIFVHPELSLEDRLDEWKDQEDWSEGDPLPSLEHYHYNNDVFNLAEIIKKIPTGILPSEVVISLKRDRSMEFAEIVISARRPTDKDILEQQYQQALKNYELELEQYQKDVVAYQTWKTKTEIRNKEQEILTLKAQLAQIKK